MAETRLKDDIAALRRAMRIWREYAPKYWIFSTVDRVLRQISGYFSLTMSALLLDEVSGAKDEKRLIIFALLTVFGGFIFSILNRAAQMRKTVLDSQNFYKYHQIMFDANCNLQYEHLESPDVRLLCEKINSTTGTIQGGLMSVLYNVPIAIGALTDLVLSLSLTAAELFATASGQFTGILGFINSRWSVLIMLLIIGIFSALTAKLRIARRKREDEARTEISLTSRRYNAYGVLWDPDMTIFGLHPSF